MPLNIRIQWNAGIACVSECVLKTLACRSLRVGPSKGKALQSPQNNILHCINLKIITLENALARLFLLLKVKKPCKGTYYFLP